MAAYDPSEWTDLFVATAGASAAPACSPRPEAACTGIAAGVAFAIAGGVANAWVLLIGILR